MASQNPTTSRPHVIASLDARQGARGQSRMWLGILLFSAALAVRVWGLSFGLPHSFSGDEINKRDAALALADTHFVHTDRQPSFIYNSLFVLYWAARAVHGGWTPVDYHYMGRLWMAVLGALTVVAVWKLGNLFDRRVGLASALLLAVLPLHTACSRYIKEDAPLGLMVTLAVLALVAYARGPTRRRLMLVGLVTGFAVSTKYTGIVMLLPALIAVGVSAYRRPQPVTRSLVDLGTLVGFTAVGFFLLSPIYLFNPVELVEGFFFQRDYSMAGHDGIVIDPWTDWWTYYLRTGLLPGMTLPVLLLALAGLLMILRVTGGWVVSLSAVWIYLVLEHALAKPAPFPARYLMPVVPLLCVAGGVALVRVAELLKARWPAPVAYTACAVVFVAPPLIMSSLITLEALNDSRLVAARWMEEHIPPSSTIVVADGPENLPPSERWKTTWQVDNREGEGLDASWRGQVAPYFVISSFKFQRFLDSPASVPERTAFYRTVMNDFDLVKSFEPRWLTYGKHSPVIHIYRPSMPRATVASGTASITP